MKYKWFYLALVLGMGCSLSSKKWDIQPDAQKLAFRKTFLESPAPPLKEKAPNVIIILADDLGKTDISHYGGTQVKTPYIDGIGQQGATFTEGYVSSPICSPSRAALLTGRYQQRFGYEYQPHERYPKNYLEYFVYQNFMDSREWNLTKEKDFPDQAAIMQQGLPLEELTLAELMQRQGYATGIVGKWHLGVEEHCWPNQRGFDQQFGFYEAYTLYQPDTANPNILNQRHEDFSDKYIWGGGRKGNCALRSNHTVIEDSVYLTTRLAIEAGKFIDQHKSEPFFLYVPFSAPHTPFQVPREYYDQFAHVEDRNKRIYYGMIKALDDAVGYILMKLEQSGVAENTMVWFLSDNGGATYTHATDNHPLKGGKFTNFEGGLNVPFLWKWPAKIKPATKCSQPVVAMDVFASIAWAAGLQLPDDREYDGVSLLPYLWGKAGEAPHPALFWRSHYSWAVRQGPWKLVCDEKSGHRVLYNLEEDKEEKSNLYNISPDQAKLLDEAYKEWEKKMKPPKWQYVMDFKYETKDGEFYFPL